MGCLNDQYSHNKSFQDRLCGGVSPLGFLPSQSPRQAPVRLFQGCRACLPARHRVVRELTIYGRVQPQDVECAAPNP